MVLEKALQQYISLVNFFNPRIFPPCRSAPSMLVKKRRPTPVYRKNKVFDQIAQMNDSWTPWNATLTNAFKSECVQGSFEYVPVDIREDE